MLVPGPGDPSLELALEYAGLPAASRANGAQGGLSGDAELSTAVVARVSKRVLNGFAAPLVLWRRPLYMLDSWFILGSGDGVSSIWRDELAWEDVEVRGEGLGCLLASYNAIDLGKK